MSQTPITIKADINAPLDKVWNAFNSPEAIRQWNYASDEWHCPASVNDLRPGGAFSHTMAAKDGSMSFDFAGVYSNVQLNDLVEYTLGDGRKVKVRFQSTDNGTYLEQTFDPEDQNAVEMQEAGWQAILNNFKQFVEKQSQS